MYKKIMIPILCSCITLFGASPGERVWNIVSDSQVANTQTASVLEAMAPVAAQLKLAQSEADQITSIADIINSSLDNIDVSASDSNLFETLCTVESRIDIITEIDTIEQSIGIPITQADVDTSGFTINAAGTYVLIENINYMPAGANPAITINADNVALNLNGYSITETPGGSVHGISVSNQNNITIINGTIVGFSGAGFYGILCDSNGSHLFIDNINIRQCNEGIHINQCDDIVISNASFNTNSTGLSISTANEIQVQNCSFASNTTEGLLASSCNQVHVNNCSAFSNTLNLHLSSVTDGSMIHCYASGGTAEGISVESSNGILLENNFTTDNQTGVALSGSNITYINNVSVGNSMDNLLLQAGSNDCIIQNNVFSRTSGVNVRELTSAGPSTFLGNCALANSHANNYTSAGSSFFNRSNFSQTASFASPAPTAFVNASIITS